MQLYLEGAMTDNPRIVGGDKQEYTLAQAKSLWDTGVVDNYNGSFLRLTQYGFDFEKLREHYRKGGR